MSSKKLDFKKILNRLIIFIGIGVVAHILFVLSTTQKSMLVYLNDLSFAHIATIVILMLCPWMGYAARIVMWSGFFKEKISYADALRVVITADVASALSPTAVGGAPVKGALLLNRGYAPGNVGFMLTYGMIEDIIFYITGIVLAGFYSTGLLTSIGLTISSFVSQHFVAIAIFAMVLFTYIGVLRMGKLPTALKLSTYIPSSIKHRMTGFREKFYHSLTDMKSNFKLAFAHGKWRMLISISVLFLQWLAKFSVLVVILNAFGVDFDTIQIYIRQWVVFVTMLFVPTPGASGGAEASFLLIFGKSIPKELAYLIVSVWRLFTYYFILLIAVFAYTGLTFFIKKQEDITVEISD